MNKYSNIQDVPNPYFIKTVATAIPNDQDVYEYAINGISSYDMGVIYETKENCVSDLILLLGLNEETASEACVMLPKVYEVVVPGVLNSGAMGENSITFETYDECELVVESEGIRSEYPDAYCQQLSYEKQESEVCATFSNGIVCVKPNNYENIDSIIEEFESAGATCGTYNVEYDDQYEYDGYTNIRCTNGDSNNLINCNIADPGSVVCSDGDAYINSSGSGNDNGAPSDCLVTYNGGSICN